MSYDLEFKECFLCSSKQGTPPLCAGCLHNRTVICMLKERVKELEAELENRKPAAKDQDGGGAVNAQVTTLKNAAKLLEMGVSGNLHVTVDGMASDRRGVDYQVFDVCGLVKDLREMEQSMASSQSAETRGDDGGLAVVVNQRGVKRSLFGPFELCLDQVALHALKERLAELDEDKWHYGWVTIYSKPTVYAKPNTQPLTWTEAAP